MNISFKSVIKTVMKVSWEKYLWVYINGSILQKKFVGSIYKDI